MSADDEALRRRVGDADVVRAAFDDLPFSVTVLEGPEHRVIAANAAHRAMVNRSDYLDLPLRESFPEFGTQHVFEMIDRVYATGEPYRMRAWRLNLVIEDGAEPLELFADIDFVPRFATDGTVRGIVCTASDVTQQVRERLAAQQQTALAERRFARARDVIAALQRELLPPGLPVLPGLTIAGSYLLADADTAAGGDWFDALALPDGRIALTVGDVVGHGVAASATMGQLRAVLSHSLAAGSGLATAMTAVDQVADRIRGARSATVCVAVLDPHDGSLAYCTAGHPPPLLLPTDGEPRFLPITGAGPLGTGSTFPLGADRLDAGDVVLLLSDGILERPGREVTTGTVELAQVAADTMAGRALRSDEASTVERVCTQTLELLVRVTGHSDDITLLAAQRVPAVPDLHADHPADDTAVPALRATLRTWLDELGVSEDDGFALLHGVGELVTNAVEHARPPGPAAGTVALSAALDGHGVLRVEVRDQGRWRRTDGIVPDGFRPSAPGRGRGLEMVRGLLDELHVEPGPGGTTVWVTRRLTRPARLLTVDDIRSGAAPAPARRPDTARLDVADEPGSRLRLDGPLDAATAPGLELELQRRTRGGTRPLTLDLSGITHLASAGVALLHALTGLRLLAPAGSVAQQVLALVALPHLTRDPDRADDTTADPLDATHPGILDDEVHQATGVVMAQLAIPAPDAMARLRAHAFTHDRPLLDVARDVVGGRLRFTDDMP